MTIGTGIFYSVVAVCITTIAVILLAIAFGGRK